MKLIKSLILLCTTITFSQTNYFHLKSKYKLAWSQFRLDRLDEAGKQAIDVLNAFPALKNALNFALDVRVELDKFNIEFDLNMEARIGLDAGPRVAGVIGDNKFIYDLWGDTVNIASRMESAGKEGRVNISEATYNLLKDNKEFTFEDRGEIAAKGKGKIKMYFVNKVS